MALIEEFSSLDELAYMSTDELVDFIRKKGKNHFDDPEEIAEAVQRAAKNSYRPPQVIADTAKQMLAISMNKIAQLLMKKSIPAPSGGEKWHRRTVESILTNEKYKGSALLQKKFTVDFLTKKQKVNEGEVPQYFIEDSHPPIIDPQEFELV